VFNQKIELEKLQRIADAIVREKEIPTNDIQDILRIFHGGTNPM